MTRNQSKIELIVDGRKITTEGTDVALRINGVAVCDDSVLSSIRKLEKSKIADLETLEVLTLTRIITAMFGHPERYRIVVSLREASKTFTEIQQSLDLKPATLDFHLKKLLNELVISKTGEKRKYELTVIGEEVLDYFTGFLKPIQKNSFQILRG